MEMVRPTGMFTQAPYEPVFDDPQSEDTQISLADEGPYGAYGSLPTTQSFNWNQQADLLTTSNFSDNTGLQHLQQLQHQNTYNHHDLQSQPSVGLGSYHGGTQPDFDTPSPQTGAPRPHSHTSLVSAPPLNAFIPPPMPSSLSMQTTAMSPRYPYAHSYQSMPSTPAETSAVMRLQHPNPNFPTFGGSIPQSLSQSLPQPNYLSRPPLQTQLSSYQPHTQLVQVQSQPSTPTSQLQRVLIRHSLQGRNAQLVVRQQPEVGSITKVNNKPLQPAPVIELVTDRDPDVSTFYQHSPYLFVIATLTDHTGNNEMTNLLQPHTSSSLHRLKPRKDGETFGAYFILNNILVTQHGRYRLRVTLYEFNPVAREAMQITSVLTEDFKIVPPKDLPKNMATTELSFAFDAQGVRLKKSRKPAAGSKRRREDSNADEAYPHAVQRARWDPLM